VPALFGGSAQVVVLAERDEAPCRACGEEAGQLAFFFLGIGGILGMP